MSSLLKRRLVLVTAAVGVVAMLLAVYFLPFHHARGSSASECRTLPVAARISGVAMDQERGVAYLAYLDAAKQSSGKAPRGTIMLMDLNVAEPRVRAALVTEPPDFQPLAVSLFAPKQGPRRLFVIDHENAVQIFEQSPSGAFERVKTVHDPQFANLVEIAPAGPQSFYLLSRPHGWFGKWRASSMFYDGTRAAPATQAFPQGSRVYVNEKARKSLEVLERDAGSDLQACRAGAITPSS
jgi:hypothetical protein